jgi:CubicO group peptidase (beta-lactamase class C family)
VIKRTAFILTILAILIALLNPIVVQAVEPGVDFKALLNERMPGLLAKYGVPGAVISYIQNGEVAWTQAYTVANLATGQPMQPGMIFNFGSCGKVLTARASPILGADTHYCK